MNTTRLILAASAGNALEFYDFTVFGYFALQIGDAFFPLGGHAGSQALTWATYAVSFLLRPLGALVLGSYADRQGRKAAMTVSIALMTLGTALIAALPGYRTIGLLAPGGIILGRLLQGFSAGGEFGGATAFMMEHSRRRRGFFASFQFTSQAVSTLLGAGAAYATSVILGQQALHDWGFRLPFALGLLIGPVGLYVRRHVDESPVFERQGPAASPARDVLRLHGGRIALGAATIAAGTGATYIAIYLPSYAMSDLHMTASSSYAVPLLGSLLSVAVTPAAAILSDRIGRFTPALVGAALLTALAYPSFWLITRSPYFATLAVVMAALTVLRAGYSAALPALFGELFPPRLRGAGMSLTYAFGVLIFGSFAPLILDTTIRVTGNRTIPGLYLGGCGIVTLAALLLIRRRMRLFSE
jgi:MHS family proline/betaine transporter-like MFS transporter